MTTTEKYIYQVYIEKSFSKAARSLFISQPSLSTAVSHKEKELGFQIFDRTTKPISLTPQGHIYLDMLDELIESEKNMHMRLKSLSNTEQNSVRIGGSASSMYYLMPLICGSFYRDHPEIEVMIDLGNLSATSSLFERITHFQKLDRGEMDAVFCYEYDTNNFHGIRIYSERLVVAMHKDLVSKDLLRYAVTRDELLGESYDEKKVITQKNMFRDIPFFDFAKWANTKRHMHELLGEYRLSNHTISNARHSIVHFNMMCAGVGAMLTSDCVVSLSKVSSDKVLYFLFSKEASMRDIFIAVKKDVPQNQSTQKFIQTAKKVCGSDMPLCL